MPLPLWAQTSRGDGALSSLFAPTGGATCVTGDNAQHVVAANVFPWRPLKTVLGWSTNTLADNATTEATLGITNGMLSTFVDFVNAPAFPWDWAAAAKVRGASLLISWEPHDWEGTTTQPAYRPALVAAGDFDTYITSWLTDAQSVAAEQQVIVRFAPEMNDSARAWSVGQNGGNTAADFIAMWRRVYGIKQAVAPDVEFMFSTITFGSVSMASVFPGARFVDSLGLGGVMFNAGTNEGTSCGWQSPDDIFSAAIAELKALAPAKPWGLSEFASAPSSALAAFEPGGVCAGSWGWALTWPENPPYQMTTADWLTQGGFIEFAIRRAIDAGASFTNLFSHNKERDWRITTDSATVTRLQTFTPALGLVTGGPFLGMSGGTTLTASGEVAFAASATLTAESTLTAGGLAVAVASATLTGESSLTASGVTVAVATAPLTGESSLTASGDVVPGGSSAALTVESSLTADGTVVKAADSSLTVESALTSAAVRVHVADSALTAQSEVAAGAFVAHSVASTLTAESALAGAAVTVTSGGCALTVESGLVGSADRLVDGAAALTAQSDMVADAIIPVLAASSLTFEASLSALPGPIYRLILPTRSITRTRHPLLGRVEESMGVALLLKDGVGKLKKYPSDFELTAADSYWLGGYNHPISSTERAAVVAAGFGGLIEEA